MVSGAPKELIHNLQLLNLRQGVNKTAVSYLDIYRLFDADIKLPELYKPFIFYIAAGDGGLCLTGDK